MSSPVQPVQALLAASMRREPQSSTRQYPPRCQPRLPAPAASPWSSSSSKTWSSVLTGGTSARRVVRAASVERRNEHPGHRGTTARIDLCHESASPRTPAEPRFTATRCCGSGRIVRNPKETCMWHRLSKQWTQNCTIYAISKSCAENHILPRLAVEETNQAEDLENRRRVRAELFSNQVRM